MPDKDCDGLFQKGLSKLEPKIYHYGLFPNTPLPIFSWNSTFLMIIASSEKGIFGKFSVIEAKENWMRHTWFLP